MFTKKKSLSEKAIDTVSSALGGGKDQQSSLPDKLGTLAKIGLLARLAKPLAVVAAIVGAGAMIKAARSNDSDSDSSKDTSPESPQDTSTETTPRDA